MVDGNDMGRYYGEGRATSVVWEQDIPVLYGLFPASVYNIHDTIQCIVSHTLFLSLPVYLFDELAVDLIT